MNKISTKIIVIVTCAVLCLSGVVTAFALTGNKKEEQKKSTPADTAEIKTSDAEEIVKD